MRIIKNVLFVVTILTSLSCKPKFNENKPVVASEVADAVHPEIQDLSQFETAYFASGCFWCVEAIFENVKGVHEVVSGYSGGSEENPTYQQVARGLTTHAEAVKVYYDADVISFNTLVQVFFSSHDPTTFNRQGPDRGPQYRSIAFYKNEDEKKFITDYIASLEEKKVYNAPIVTEVKAFEKFYVAEEYHQDFERKNPNNSYIRNISVPRYNRFKEIFPEVLKEDAH